MPKQYRLRDKNLIKKCANNGKKVFTQYFIIKELESNDKKFAVIISKKMDKRASIRNKIKRQIRNIIYKHIDIAPYGIMLIIVKNDINDIVFSKLQEDLLKGFKLITKLNGK